MILQLRKSATKQKYDYTKQNKAEKMASEKGLTKPEGKKITQLDGSSHRPRTVAT